MSTQHIERPMTERDQLMMMTAVASLALERLGGDNNRFTPLAVAQRLLYPKKVDVLVSPINDDFVFTVNE